jgi:Mn2+/Fe2+ NRAMP family transporter
MSSHFWSAVINGVIAVPVMAAMMFMVGHKGQIGRFTAGRGLKFLGWASTTVMAAATALMVALSAG